MKSLYWGVIAVIVLICVLLINYWLVILPDNIKLACTQEAHSIQNLDRYYYNFTPKTPTEKEYQAAYNKAYKKCLTREGITTQ